MSCGYWKQSGISSALVRDMRNFDGKILTSGTLGSGFDAQPVTHVRHIHKGLDSNSTLDKWE